MGVVLELSVCLDSVFDVSEPAAAGQTMMKITVDEALRTRLHNLDSPLELCDESGRVLGHFTPAVDHAIYEGVESPNGEEELQRRSQQGGGRPLRDILGDLQRRE